MPQLDFREALSTPEQKVYSTPATAPAPRVPQPQSFLRDIGLSHSTWANIVFVAIATAGAIGSAFYFFNGAELLRAAAAWPGEFLYARPALTEKIDVAVQPIAADRYDRDIDNSTATKNAEDENSSTDDLRSPRLAQAIPFIETQGTNSTTFPSDGPSLPSVQPIIPVTPVTPILPVPPLQPVVPPPADSIFHELNSLQPARRTFVQSTLDTVTETVSSVLPKAAPAPKVAATRKKVASAKTKVTTKGAVSSTSKSTSQTTQKIANQVQAPIIQNQTMFGGGMGVTSGGLSGSGAVGGVAGSVSGGGVGTSGGVGGVGSVGGVGGVGSVGGIGGVGGVGGIGGIGGVGGLPGIGGLPGVGGLGGGLPGHH